MPEPLPPIVWVIIGYALGILLSAGLIAAGRLEFMYEQWLQRGDSTKDHLNAKPSSSDSSGV